MRLHARVTIRELGVEREDLVPQPRAEHRLCEGLGVVLPLEDLGGDWLVVGVVQRAEVRVGEELRGVPAVVRLELEHLGEEVGALAVEGRDDLLERARRLLGWGRSGMDYGCVCARGTGGGNWECIDRAGRMCSDIGCVGEARPRYVAGGPKSMARDWEGDGGVRGRCGGGAREVWADGP